MAKYVALVAADTVGDPNETIEAPTPICVFVAPGYINVIYSAEYKVGKLDDSNNLLWINKFKYADEQYRGGDELTSVWKNPDGESYSYTEYSNLYANPDTTTEQVNQFYFKFDDKIKGSHEEDHLCGWAGDDKMWGFEQADTFYYGKGMGKDEICDFEYKKDQIMLDDSAGTKFKKVAKKAKYNEKKEFTQLKLGDGDKLKIYGIDSRKELKKSLAFDDFTDFA